MSFELNNVDDIQQSVDDLERLCYKAHMFQKCQNAFFQLVFYLAAGGVIVKNTPPTAPYLAAGGVKNPPPAAPCLEAALEGANPRIF